MLEQTRCQQGLQAQGGSDCGGHEGTFWVIERLYPAVHIDTALYRTLRMGAFLLCRLYLSTAAGWAVVGGQGCPSAGPPTCDRSVSGSVCDATNLSVTLVTIGRHYDPSTVAADLLLGEYSGFQGYFAINFPHRVP